MYTFRRFRATFLSVDIKVILILTKLYCLNQLCGLLSWKMRRVQKFKNSGATVHAKNSVGLAEFVNAFEIFRCKLVLIWIIDKSRGMRCEDDVV